MTQLFSFFSAEGKLNVFYFTFHLVGGRVLLFIVHSVLFYRSLPVHAHTHNTSEPQTSCDTLNLQPSVSPLPVCLESFLQFLLLLLQPLLLLPQLLLFTKTNPEEEKQGHIRILIETTTINFIPSPELQSGT